MAKLSFPKKIHNIRIVGDAQFIELTKKALELIRITDSEMWDLVTKYIKFITANEKSGMRAWTKAPAFDVAPPTSETETMWYASGICHDAYHSKLYNDYYDKYGHVPDDVWTGRQAEDKCLDIQIKFLKKIKGSEEYIEHLQNMKHVDYFSDYDSRDW